MKKYFHLIILTSILFIGLSFQQASALTVSPAKVEIEGDPGTILSGIINLFNEQDVAETLYTSFENFEPGDDSGTPRFVGGDSALATWISITSIITLEPGERAQVPFEISIPSEVDPGGYFAAIFFGNQPPSTDGAQVSIGGRLGILMLLRVNGDISENAEISFNTLNNENLYTNIPVNFEYKFSNSGGDRVVPKGDIVIKNLFGLTATTINANAIEGSVLPNSARKFKTTWSADQEAPAGFINILKYQWKNFHVGYYTAHLNLGWGRTNQTGHLTSSFFLIPWQILVVLIGIILIVWTLFKLIVSSYRKSIIRELQRQQNSHINPSPEIDIKTEPIADEEVKEQGNEIKSEELDITEGE